MAGGGGGGPHKSEHIEMGDNNMITGENFISRDNSSYRLKMMRNIYVDKIIINY